MDRRNSDCKFVNFAKLHLDVVKGRSNGKIIWQPRIGCWYTDKKFAHEKFPEPYDGMTLPEIYRELGCSNRIYDYNECFKQIDDPRVKRYQNKLSERETEYVIDTPIGKITSIGLSTPNSPHEIRKKWWITCEEDIRVASWVEERCSWEWEQNVFEEIESTWGDIGAPTMFMPRINIQHLYINVMGVEQTIYALCDYRDTVEKYFQVMNESHSRLIEVINKSPIDIINFGDNLHAGTLSPEWFKKYVLPAYLKRNEQLHKAGKFTCSHWDGDTKGLLPFAKECGLDGIEAITPKPQGDVTLEEVKEALGDQVFLLDGISAVLFDSIYPIEELLEQAKKVIELFAPKLILGISDEISSTGEIERIRTVGKLVDDYNTKVVR